MLTKQVCAAVAAALLASSGTAIAKAHRDPLPPRLGIHGIPLRPPTVRELKNARQVWTPVTASAPFTQNGAGTPVLMMDGTVMIQDNYESWYRLTPDAYGSYINGTWSQAPSLPGGYAPLYFADAVLPDGRLIIEGGEYNFFNQTETNLGAIYDPIANTWTSVAPPSGWQYIGDGQSAVLANGTFMLGNCCSSIQALLDPTTLTWTNTGTGKEDDNSEEGWSLLPNGNVLTVDVTNSKIDQSESYAPMTGAWTNAGNTGVNLSQYSEIGPQVLRPDGTVFATGATSATAVYHIRSGKWKPGPTMPTEDGKQLDVADGPGSLLVDGNVLFVASPGAYSSPSYFFEFNGKKLIPVPGTPNAPQDPSYSFRLLPLPNGQVLATDGSNDVEIYTHGGKPDASSTPTISSLSTTLTHGTTTALAGMYLNGFSQAGAYGDDAQEATNFPLVRITNNSTGHVFYARTHDPSSMGVAVQSVVSVNFDVPSNIELGASTLVVVANGIASLPAAVTID
jgi:hypothetical protein